ncbi:high mobility group box domain-containing protein [Mycena latifolia]|nr:high mobility group box domain-containing protein [Mycena latifolia]
MNSTPVHAPKLPTSAFMLFCSDQRQVVKEANPDAPFSMLGRLLGEAWQALSEAEKGVYEDRAAEDLARYQAESAKYAMHKENQ